MSNVVPISDTALPAGLSAATWREFVEFRQEDLKKPMTPRAEKMVLRKLTRLSAQGHCPELLLERSIANGWQDVYPNETTKRPWNPTDGGSRL